MTKKNYADWAHKKQKLKIMNDDDKLIKKVDDDCEELIVENLPEKYARKYRKDGIKIWMVHGNRIREFGNSKGEPKLDSEAGDIIDVKFIKEFHLLHPEFTYENLPKTNLQDNYKTFKDIQKQRIKREQRDLAKGIDKKKDETYKAILEIETNMLKEISKELEKYLVWTWLKEIKGMGPAIAAGLIANIDLERVNYNGDRIMKNVSNLWSYAGLSVENGKALRRKKGESISVNSKLKALLVGVFGDSIIKQRTPVYREFYDKVKEAELEKKYHPGYLSGKYNGYKKSDIMLSRGHANNRAIRKTIKLFLQHYYVIGCQQLGLDTRPPFVHEKLKHNGYILPPCIPESLLPFKPF